MISKQNLIDLLMNRLSGGDTPRDIRRLYPPAVISKVVNFAISDIVTRNRDAAVQMAISYEFEVSNDANGYFIELSPKPINGTNSIFLVEDASTTYNIQTQTMAKTIKTLRGSNKHGAIYFSGKLRFNQKPDGLVSVTQVPNVNEMENTDMLMLQMNSENIGESEVFQMCLQILKTPEYQDDLNNNNIDAQNRA